MVDRWPRKEGMSRLTVKVHMDDMKRATIREQNYFYHEISKTPFTLGIAFPNKYGQFRVTGGTEMARNNTDGGLIATSNGLLYSFLLLQCSAPTGGSCIRTGCIVSTTLPSPTTESSKTHQRTTCATSSIGSPMKGSGSTGEIAQLPERTPTSVSILMWPFPEAQKPETFRIATFYAQKFSGRSAWILFSRHIKKECNSLSQHIKQVRNPRLRHIKKAGNPLLRHIKKCAIIPIIIYLY